MLTPLLKGADSPPLLYARAAQFFLLFIWSAKAELFACKLWRAWIQLLSTHFTHTDIRMDGCQFSVLAGIQTRWLLSLLGFHIHDLKKKKRRKKIPKHKTNNPLQTFLRCYRANFPSLLFCKLSLWKRMHVSSTLSREANREFGLYIQSYDTTNIRYFLAKKFSHV